MPKLEDIASKIELFPYMYTTQKGLCGTDSICLTWWCIRVTLNQRVIKPGETMTAGSIKHNFHSCVSATHFTHDTNICMPAMSKGVSCMWCEMEDNVWQPVILISSSQWRERIALFASWLNNGSWSRKSSMICLQSMYACQSRRDYTTKVDINHLHIRCKVYVFVHADCNNEITSIHMCLQQMEKSMCHRSPTFFDVCWRKYAWSISLEQPTLGSFLAWAWYDKTCSFMLSRFGITSIQYWS